jgi:hypothetical protein
MTTQDDFIRQLEGYLDDHEGPTPLPETVRDAVRAALPRTKQSRPVRGPARYLMMNANPMVPVALAAAAAILAVAVGAFLLTRPNVGGPDDAGPSVQASASPAVAASSSPTTACSESTRLLRESTVEVTWCSARGDGINVAVPFTLEAPSSWFDEMYGNRRQLWIRPSGGGTITLVLPEDQSVDEVVADISGRANYVVENSAAVTLGGASGSVFDVRLADGASSGDAPPLIVGDEQSWVLQADNMARVWVVDHAGETVMFVTGQELADDLGEALATLEWGN